MCIFIYIYIYIYRGGLQWPRLPRQSYGGCTSLVEFLKSRLVTHLTIENHYRADFWEFLQKISRPTAWTTAATTFQEFRATSKSLAQCSGTANVCVAECCGVLQCVADCVAVCLRVCCGVYCSVLQTFFHVLRHDTNV